jgi:hypothetical protein
MIQEFTNYLAFFVISSIVFTFIGLLSKYYIQRDLYKIFSRLTWIFAVSIFYIWALTTSNETNEETVNNIMTVVNIFIFIFVPWIIGEIISEAIRDIFEKLKRG